MSWRSRVAWSQGMFLQPQHFQQEMRALERVMDVARNCAAADAWGFTKLELDESALAIGRVAISSATGILPDGTPFSTPTLEATPLPLEIAPDFGNELVYLGAPVARQSAVEYDFGDAADPALARFRVETQEVRDQSSVASDAVPIQVARLNLRLLRGKEATDAYAVVAVARVKERRPDMQVVLDRDFIPPQITIGATPHLVASVAGFLRGMLAQRSEALAGRLGQLSHGVSELADFLVLQTVNRHEPLFSQYAQLARHHPQALYESCLQLAGDLATLLSPKRRPPQFPVYRHDNLAGTFAPVMVELRNMLSMAIQSNVVSIELVQRNHGVMTASVADVELLHTATFVLAINADMPGEQLRSRFLAQSKIAPADRIAALVNSQLPGIVARQLPVAPRQLPFHGGYHYFELERGTELWKQFERHGNLAIHMPGDFPQLAVEFWAIRQS
jgi:type VI secretion system protein ImpJ